MKEFYNAPEVEIVKFAPAEALATEETPSFEFTGDFGDAWAPAQKD